MSVALPTLQVVLGPRAPARACWEIVPEIVQGLLQADRQADQAIDNSMRLSIGRIVAGVRHRGRLFNGATRQRPG